MSDFQAIADRVEIEGLRGEFTDAAMMRDRARLASLFTPDGACGSKTAPSNAQFLDRSEGFAQIDIKAAQQRDITVRGIEHVQFAPADAKRLTERAMAE